MHIRILIIEKNNLKCKKPSTKKKIQSFHCFCKGCRIWFNWLYNMFFRLQHFLHLPLGVPRLLALRLDRFTSMLARIRPSGLGLFCKKKKIYLKKKLMLSFKYNSGSWLMWTNTIARTIFQIVICNFSKKTFEIRSQ